MQHVTMTRLRAARRHFFIAVLALCAMTACSYHAFYVDGPGDREPAPRGGFNGDFDPATGIYWAWDTPLGQAADTPHVIEMVRVSVHYLDGRTAADEVCDIIRERRLRSGEICILLQGFGEGGGDPDGKKWHVKGQTPLFLHWEDGLAQHTTEYWYYTPWCRRGIDVSRAWMQDFITRYKARQLADQSIPDPSRFHFDSEGGVRVTWRPFAALKAFDAMVNDPRWSGEVLPGVRKTMAQLYDEAGRPSYDPDQEWYRRPNHEWSIWYQGLGIEISDAAMNEAAYTLIRDAWPSARSSNYRTATTFDGVDGRFDTDGMNPWLRYVHRSYADMQAPVCYRVVTTNTRERQPLNAAVSLDLFRDRVVDIMHSAGEPDGRNIVPWLELIGNVRTVNGVEVVQSPLESWQEIHALGKMGVREFIIWSNPSSGADVENWNALADIVRGMTPSPENTGQGRR